VPSELLAMPSSTTTANDRNTALKAWWQNARIPSELQDATASTRDTTACDATTAGAGRDNSPLTLGGEY
jgi:hypothetical protein